MSKVRKNLDTTRRKTKEKTMKLRRLINHDHAA